MMALLLEPLQFTFMSHALLISLVVSIPCALLSVFLVLKSWALMGDAMSHAVFPGIVLAWILGLPLATGAFVAGVFCAVATGYLKDNSRIKQDTVMGIVFSGMFAAGLILYIAVKPDVHLDHILFGDMLGITIGDIIQTVIIAGLVTLVISVKWRDFCCSALIINRRRQAVCIRDGCIMGCCAWSPDHCGDAESGWYHSLYFSSHCAWCHCGTPDTTLSYCAPAGDWHIDIGLNDWCLAVLYRQRASSDNCCLIRGHVHHDVYRYQHQRTHKGKCRTTGFVIIRLAEHSASNIRLLAMRLNE